MGDESVKVAVRVRPFNSREKERNAQLIIQMNGAMTTIKNPDPAAANEKPKEFTFDYSYWSHDGFTEQESDGVLLATNKKYATQRDVFNNLGQGVLDNAFAGYNCSLFAYGQTGSGKSYSMVGYGQNTGIVPITCDELFKTMAAGAEGIRYEVSFSMLEIYNEQVRDLLSKENPKGGLPVRQNPKLGLFYVQGLKMVPVGSYKEIEKRMEQGTAHRTVASTQMNATSSRAHTVVTITFNQISKNAEGQETKKSSVMNLVDLAGSERADSTGATGDRLKEGANINKSLSALGNVISALADLSMGKKKVMVPYRDSVLTKLLQNALGGNSKTIMIAALSPADINYDETLGTLRYADRAKKIKNKAVINENPMDKLIRELKEENEKLKKAMEGGGVIQQTAGMSQADIEKMKKEMEEEIRAQLMANQQMLGESEESWESKLKAARSEEDDTAGIVSGNVRKAKEPHFVNLNEDPMLSGVIIHIINKGEMTIGRKDAEPSIVLSGLSINKNHALVTYNDDEIVIKPVDKGSKTKINGQPITGAQALAHKDRVMFGSNHLYVFMNPLKTEEASADLPKTINWEFAQKEIAQAKGFNTGSGAGLSKEQQIAQEQVLEILPMVSEINAVSEELDKHKSFEVVLMSAAAYGGSSSQETRVMVKMKNLLNGNSWLWERGKFMNRRYLMQEHYQSFLDGDDTIKDMPKEEDPFWEPADDVCIGTCNVFLQSLAYALDFDDQLIVTDYKGEEEGKLVVNITPCTQNGKALDEDFFVEDPSELLLKPYHFKISIRNADIHKARYSKGIHICYNVKVDANTTVFAEDVNTETKKGTLTPEFNHSKIVSFPSINQAHLDFFDSGAITFRVMATQEDSVGESKLAKMTTKELRAMEHLTRPTLNHKHSSFGLDTSLGDNAQLKSEFMVMKRKFERLEQKERRLQEICEEWGKKPQPEQEFGPFYRQVSALAKSTGVRLKTRVQMLSKVLQGQKMIRERNEEDPESGNEDDTVSLYVFGEEEDRLSQEAQQNGGVINYDKVAPHVASTQPHVLQAQKKAAAKNGTSGKVTAKGVEKEGSRACVIM